MEKVNAPATGWLSAETTWYATVKVPSGSPARSFTAYCAPPEPSDRGVSSVSTRLPAGSRTRMASSSTAICSEKVSETSFGACSTTESCCGSLPVSAACAPALPAPASTASPARSTASRTGSSRAATALRGAAPPLRRPVSVQVISGQLLTVPWCS